jgi:hypothetical protein
MVLVIPIDAGMTSGFSFAGNRLATMNTEKCGHERLW